ncbi:MAG: TRAM domain-containing protein, partial [Pseudomonadota bacterium]
EKVHYASAFSFKYSPRPGTPAAELRDMVPDDVASERLQRLQALLFDQQRYFNASLVGHTIEVLAEKAGRYEGQMVGRSPYLQAVYFENEGDYSYGDMLKVRIIEASQNALRGEVIDKDLQQVHHNHSGSLLENAVF